MASAVGSIIGGVLSGTGGAGSEFAPAIESGVNKYMVSEKPKDPQINSVEVKEAVTPSATTSGDGSNSSETWTKLAERARGLSKKTNNA